MRNQIKNRQRKWNEKGEREDASKKQREVQKEKRWQVDSKILMIKTQLCFGQVRVTILVASISNSFQFFWGWVFGQVRVKSGPDMISF